MDNETIEELFQSLGGVTIKRMFGGKGIYCRGRIIALVLRDELMLKGDETSGPLYEAAGSRRWRYQKSKTGKDVAMPYWSVPETALDDPDEMAKWAHVALETGLRANETGR